MKSRFTPTAATRTPSPSLALRAWRPFRLTAVTWLCWLSPLFLAVAMFRYAGTHAWVSDFQATIYDPGRAVLAGHSPYPAPTLAALVGHPTFVYPPVLLWIDVPVSLLPFAVAQVVWRIGLGLAVLAALWLAGVRDRRALALGLLALPTVYGILMGNVSLLLVLGVALAWRHRERILAGGVAVGLLVAVKLLLWPLFVWLLITRRFRSVAIAATVGIVAVLSSWVAIGFDGFADYPRLVHLVSGSTAGPRALSVSVLAKQLGLSGGGHVAQWGCGALLLGFAVFAARRKEGDRRAFSLAVIAALIFSPVVWLHYFAFLLIPIALASPSWGAAWSIPWAFWLTLFATGSHEFVVSSSGQTVGRFGVAPSGAKIVLVLLITAAAAAYTGAESGAPGRWTLRLRAWLEGHHLPPGSHGVEERDPNQGLVHT